MVSMKHKWCLVFDGRYQEVLLVNLEGMTNFKNFYNAISLHTGAKLKGGMGGGGGGGVWHLQNKILETPGN